MASGNDAEIRTVVGDGRSLLRSALIVFTGLSSLALDLSCVRVSASDGEESSSTLRPRRDAEAAKSRDAVVKRRDGGAELSGLRRELAGLLSALNEGTDSATSKSCAAWDALSEMDKAIRLRSVQILRDSDSGARRAAIRHLTAGLRDQEVAAIVAALSDRDSDVQFSAICGAGRLRMREAIPHLIQILASPETHDGFGVRCAAIEALGRIGGSESQPFLTRELRSAKDAGLRESSAIALGRLGASGSREMLTSVLADQREPERVRGAAAEGLGILAAWDEQAADVLLQFLVPASFSKEPNVLLCRVVTSLGYSRLPKVARRLAEVLSNSDIDSEIRGAAAGALGNTRHSTALGLLLKALANDDATIRQGVYLGLLALGSKEAEEAIMKAFIRAPSGTEGRVLSAMMGYLKDQRAIRILEEALVDDRYNDVRDSIRVSLARAKGEPLAEEE